MHELLRTNDPVRLSFLSALLADAGIDCIIFDAHSSAMEGSISAIPRRLMVAEEDAAQARRVLTESGRRSVLSTVSEDSLLGGRVRLRQPTTGYRAAIDPVLLAAAVEARGADRVLDLGCGVGAASLCLAARLPGLHITGWEIQSDLVQLGQENARLNAVEDRVSILHHDVAAADPALRVDQVISNPPYHDAKASDPPDHAGKATSVVEGDLAVWLKAAARALPHKGRLTLIFRADRLDALLTAMSREWGGIVVWPLWPKAGVAAKRVLIRAAKGSHAPFILGPGLILHEADGSYTDAAHAILRDGAALDW